jgi:hypothetical protein
MQRGGLSAPSYIHSTEGTQRRTNGKRREPQLYITFTTAATAIAPEATRVATVHVIRGSRLRELQTLLLQLFVYAHRDMCNVRVWHEYVLLKPCAARFVSRK